MTPVATLKGSPELLSVNIPRVEEDGSGRLITLCCDRRGIARFDSTGNLLDQWQNESSLPGEAQFLLRVLTGPGDSLHAVSVRANVVTVLDPDLVPVRWIVTPHQALLPNMVLDDGSYVVANHVPTADLIGYPIHILRSDGELKQALGSESPQYRMDLRLWNDRLISLTSDRHGIWAIAPGRYTLERWDPGTAHLTHQVSVRSAWFEESAQWNSDETRRPQPIIETIWEDPTGIVWVLLRDADIDWSPPPGANTMRPVSHEEYSRTFDWVLEAVDPGTGVVLASRRFRDPLWMNPTSGLITQLVVDSQDPTTTWDLFTPTLQTRR